MMGTAVGIVPYQLFFAWVATSIESVNDAAKGKIHHSNLYFIFLGLTCCAGLFFIVWFGIVGKEQLDKITASDLRQRRSRSQPGAVDGDKDGELGEGVQVHERRGGAGA